MEEVLFSTQDNGVAVITLNRPKAINSLNYEMLVPIREKLLEWEQDDRICLVILKGAGAKGFCAGGDIKTLYQAKDNKDGYDKAITFFTEEYLTDQLVTSFSKPILAILDGVVMGGGIGLSYGASHRIVTERSKWAMPEMNIGFFPDVGAAYFLNKAPGYAGRYLALTANVITATDVLYVNGADTAVSSNQLEALEKQVMETNWHIEQDRAAKLDLLLDTCHPTSIPDGEIEALQSKIDQHFSYGTVEQIIDSLKSDNSKFASKTKETLLSKSPISLKVTLDQLIKGENKTLEECLETDLVLARNFLKSHDFYEGVRSVVIDKDRNPKYNYQQLSDVSPSVVNSFFNVN
ncbi:enoyl-CoA hydratase/isomerase family protein [Virgibacillus salexigens]|uniref:enoyl-CoA hydratase/isomerase family protein n=1 Tax=Virgibacillus salexigens TaxID=61016 RepID=UPI0030820FE3